MEKAPKYSVIIPIYNGEKTLRRCLDSLVDQGYADARIILVDDGSTDTSGDICQEYAGAHRQITWLRREHGGVSAARNAGLEASSGEYILFIDSDDRVEPDYFRELDRMEDCDFLWFSYRQTGDGRELLRRFRPLYTEDAGQCAGIFSRALGRKTINPLWNKRYRRSIILENGLTFLEELSIGEDKLFNLRYAMCCRSLRISDMMIYHASVEDRNSLSRKHRDDLKQQFALLDGALLAGIQQMPMPEEHRALYQEAFDFTKLRSVYSDAKRMHLDGSSQAFRRRQLRQLCRESNARKGRIPRDLYSQLLRIPVRMKLVTIIDLLGYLLAKNLIYSRY